MRAARRPGECDAGAGRRRARDTRELGPPVRETGQVSGSSERSVAKRPLTGVTHRVRSDRHTRGEEGAVRARVLLIDADERTLLMDRYEVKPLGGRLASIEHHGRVFHFKQREVDAAGDIVLLVFRKPRRASG
jgi:hypothetical protein